MCIRDSLTIEPRLAELAMPAITPELIARLEKIDAVVDACIRADDAVSYTHLDVYKRQTLHGVEIMTACLKSGAVSYTHLDVYKRQPCAWVRMMCRSPSARPPSRRPSGRRRSAISCRSARTTPPFTTATCCANPVAILAGIGTSRWRPSGFTAISGWRWQGRASRRC